MLSLNTNIAAMTAQASNRAAAREASRAMEQLATGKRINSVADDPAGLAISTRLASQIIGARQAIRNANDGISLLQTADAAAGSMVSLFQRMRELRVQYDNGTNNAADKSSIANEITSLKSEISQIATTSSWNGMNLFDGGGSVGSKIFNLNISGGPSDQNQLTVETPNFLQTIGINPHSDGISFAAPTTAATGSTDISIATADFNGDGNTDLVSANVQSKTLSVLLGNGDGTFRTETLSTSPDSPCSVVTGDFNGDGKMDIVAGFFTDTIKTYFGNGDGTFQQATVQQTQLGAYNLASADLNGDGKPDLVMGYPATANYVMIALNNGDGAFGSSVSYTTGTGPLIRNIADLNADV